MGTLTVRKLDDDVHRRVKFVAQQRDISVEEAARQLLDEATQPSIRLGDAIANFNKKNDVGTFKLERLNDPVNAVEFE